MKNIFKWALLIKGTLTMLSAWASEPSLETKIGQMIMIGISGTHPSDPPIQEAIKEAQQGLIGGIIFFAYNIKSPPQIQELTSVLRSLRLSLPLLLAIDQEGGKVQRLKSLNGFADFLSAYQVASSFTPQEAENYYKQMAEQSARVGFNVVFGPVVDLHMDSRTGQPCSVIGGLERSFSLDPQIVVNYATAFIQAHHHFGILTALKHFPGHGYAARDSHQGMVDITNSHHQNEIQPFKKIIEAGLADMVMTGHLMHRQLDSRYPATLSATIIQERLRHQLGYQGVVISDDLHMGAISKHFPLREVVVQAINAGCDILLFSNNTAAAPNNQKTKVSNNLVKDIYDIIKKAIREGRLTESRINDSYRRIVDLKKKLSF